MSTTDIRAAFEAWAAKEHPDAHHIMRDDGHYKHGGMRDWWPCWQAATEAAKATGTAGEQTKQSFENIEELPPLPECAYVQHGPFANRDLFTVAQMREYGQACAEAARQPAPVISLAHQIEESNYKSAFMEWSQKTDWVQEQISSFPPSALGMHRADVMREEIARLRAALAATAAPVRNEADERDNEIFELQKALAFWLPQVNQFMSDEMSQRIAHDAYMLVIDGNLPDDFKTAQELGWILPATGKVQRDAEMVCGNCMEPIPITVMDTSSTRAPAAALSDESIDELAKPLMEQCVIVYGDMRRFARAILAATNRSQP